MATAFTTGTINAANAGAVGLAMAEKIRDDVVAHAAWELVEEYTPASSLVTWYVLKCLAAESGLPSDFYLVIGRTIGSGELRTFICEGYNAGTHVASFYCPQSGNYTLDSVGRSTSTVTLSTAVLTTAATNPRFSIWLPSGVSTKWWIIVAEDGLTVAFNGASNGYFHAGAFIPLGSTSWPMPLHLTAQDAAMGYLTRNPNVANGVGIPAVSLQVQGGGPSGSNLGPPLGFMGRLDTNDKNQNDQRPVAEVGLVGVLNAANSDFAIWGWALGKVKGVRWGLVGTAPVGFAFGDAYALEGRLWVPYLPTDTRVWDTGVPV